MFFNAFSRGVGFAVRPKISPVRSFSTDPDDAKPGTGLSEREVALKWEVANLFQKKFIEQSVSDSNEEMKKKMKKTMDDKHEEFEKKITDFSKAAKEELLASTNEVITRVDSVEKSYQKLFGEHTVLTGQINDFKTSTTKALEVSEEVGKKVNAIEESARVLSEKMKALDGNQSRMDRRVSLGMRFERKLSKKLRKLSDNQKSVNFVNRVVTALLGFGVFVTWLYGNKLSTWFFGDVPDVPKVSEPFKITRPMESIFKDAGDTDYDEAIKTTRAIVAHHDVCQARHDFDELISRLAEIKSQCKKPEEESWWSRFRGFSSDSDKIDNRVKTLQEEKKVYDILCQDQENNRKSTSLVDSNQSKKRKM